MQKTERLSRGTADAESDKKGKPEKGYTSRIMMMARPYWHLLIIAAIAMLASTGLNLVTPWLVRDLVAGLDDMETFSLATVQRYAVILVLAYAARAVCRFFTSYFSHKAAWKLVPELRANMYNHLQKLSLRYYQDKQTGQLMSRVVNDSDKIEVLIAHAVPDLAINGLILIGITAILLSWNPLLTALTFIPVPFMLVASVIFSKKIRPTFREAQETLGSLNAALQDNLSGIKEIQAFNQQDREFKRIQKHSRAYSSAILHALKLSNFFHPTVEFVTSLGTVIVVLFGGYLAIQRQLSAADIVGFLMYLSLFYAPISTLARVVEDMQQALAGSRRVFDILDAEPDIADSPDAQPLKNVKGGVKFEDVSFHYNDGQPVLDDISFEAKPGEMIALVGPTGVGKTTLISLLARFYDPVEGTVMIDDTDIKKTTLASIRDNISIVLQDVFLFNGSIADNISYGMQDATIDDIKRAARIAHADGFITQTPGGYDTLIGERGVRLSGGQKQRLSIARAVLRDSPILILDEATASVDVETEAEIQEAIGQLAGSRTIIVIAHRLSTVKRADTILVLENGKIVQRGKHEELLLQPGLYSRLCKVQLEANENAVAALLAVANPGS